MAQQCPRHTHARPHHACACLQMLAVLERKERVVEAEINLLEYQEANREWRWWFVAWCVLCVWWVQRSCVGRMGVDGCASARRRSVLRLSAL